MGYQFNRESIAPSYEKSNRTPTSRQEVADQLAAALARTSIKPTVVPGFSGVAPRPLRSSRVDPETKLKRRKDAVPIGIAKDLEIARREHDAQVKLRVMADQMEVME